MKSYLLPDRGRIVRDPEPLGEEGGPSTVPHTLYPTPLPLPVAFPAQVSQPLRYGYDGLRRFATE